MLLIFLVGEDQSRDRGSLWSHGQQPGEICLDILAFYGIVSYAVGVSLILSMLGIRVGRRFFRRRRSGRTSAQEESAPPDQQQQKQLAALWGGQAVDLATERRVPPIFEQDENAMRLCCAF